MGCFNTEEQTKKQILFANFQIRFTLFFVRHQIFGSL